MHCEIVIIEGPAGPVRINAEDYDPKIHTLVGEKPKKAEVPKSAKKHGE